MSNLQDPVERDLNRYMDDEAAKEQWYERNEAGLAEEFFELYGVAAFDEKKWLNFVDSRWVASHE